MLKDEVNKALEILSTGGIILYPTDTVWALGCDATNEIAVNKLLALKKKTGFGGLIILLDHENKLQSYVGEVPDIAYDLIEYTDKPLTIVFSGAKNLAPNVINQDGSIGIRIVKHDFCQQLLQRFRLPIVSTSANISTEATPANFSEISEQIIESVDHVVNWEQDDLTPKMPSTIMKLEPDGRFVFIRK